MTYDSARYTADYIMKAQLGESEEVYEQLGIEKPFQLMSQGLGKEMLQNEAFVKTLRASGTLTLKGVPIGIPRYYLDKLKMKPRMSSPFEDRSGPQFAHAVLGHWFPQDNVLEVGKQRAQLHQNRWAKINMLKKGKI